MRKEITKIAIIVTLSVLIIGFIFSYSGYTLAVIEDSGELISENGYKAKYLFTIEGKGKNKLIEPLNVVVDEDGLIYVSDKGDGIIKVFDSKGKYLKNIGSNDNNNNINSENNKLKYPYGMVITPKGQLWVSDPEKSSISRFDVQTGEFIEKVNLPDEGIRPGLMATNKELIYISDLKGKRILIYDIDGNEKGQILANLSFPQGLVVDNKTNLWVGDAGNHPNLKNLNSDGSLKKQIVFAKKENSLITIRGLAIDSRGHIFVADPMAHKILVFNSEGELMLDFGSNGNKNYQFNFPTGLFIDEQDQIYIADRMNKRVQVWTYQGGVK